MSDKYNRRSIRLEGYDYSSAGAYFVTVCAKERECLFGDVVSGKMCLNDAGRVVHDTWRAMPRRFPTINVDEFVIMPNHVHGIVVIDIWSSSVGAGLALPEKSALPDESIGTMDGGAASSAPTTLGDVVRAFKSISAIAVNRLIGHVGRQLWQRNYYEHIIRNEDSLNRIRAYIAANPARWDKDENNPNADPAGRKDVVWWW
jgi:putative transposase